VHARTVRRIEAKLREKRYLSVEIRGHLASRYNFEGLFFALENRAILDDPSLANDGIHRGETSASSASSESDSFAVGSRWTPILGRRLVNIPHVLLESYHSLGLSMRDVMLVIQLMSFKRDERAPFPSQELLATRMGLSTVTIRQSLYAMRDANFIRIDNHPHRSNSYHLESLFGVLESHLGEVEVVELAINRPSAKVEVDLSEAWRALPLEWQEHFLKVRAYDAERKLESADFWVFEWLQGFEGVGLEYLGLDAFAIERSGQSDEEYRDTIFGRMLLFLYSTAEQLGLDRSEDVIGRPHKVERPDLSEEWGLLPPEHQLVFLDMRAHNASKRQRHVSYWASILLPGLDGPDLEDLGWGVYGIKPFDMDDEEYRCAIFRRMYLLLNATDEQLGLGRSHDAA